MIDFRIKEVSSSLLSQDRLLELLDRLGSKKILVVGDVGLDRYVLGTVDRISPEAPVPILWVREERLKLGLAANVADNLRALGAIPTLIGVIGKDRVGDDLRHLLNRSGMSADLLVEDVTRRTVLKERVVGERQQMLRIDYESSGMISSEAENQVFQNFEASIQLVDGVILEDYAKGLLGERLIQALIQTSKKAGKWVAVDPNQKTHVQSYRGASILTPNTKEAEFLSGQLIHDLQSLAHAGFKILADTEAEHLIITRGKDGIALFSHDEKEVKLIPTSAKEVYDVSGAGDTVISVFTLAHLTGATLEEAAILSNLAAGIEVSKLGTATVSTDEMKTALEI